MKLYLVHCGFYDQNNFEGLYENHTNFFIASDSFQDAKIKIKLLPLFQSKRMHIDGIQEIEAVDGFRITLELNTELNNATKINNLQHRDLAPTQNTNRGVRNG